MQNPDNLPFIPHFVLWMRSCPAANADLACLEAELT
ncbi:hypothetical protein HDA45_000493 [Amycolatopsis umgeniensis]|uniref:Uncharacterized protein n=1 Tax=Amycolatopsis umgeniensis TaxID=336628 RepID=A0A841AR83_9PSEU|nr:hypothetical protein [Amycolatopsis umgeniensis]